MTGEYKNEKGKVVFVGNFWEFFAISIVLLVLSVVSFGIFLPYYIYWSGKYFFNNLEIEMYF